jgi:hypothetical protein
LVCSVPSHLEVSLCGVWEHRATTSKGETICGIYSALSRRTSPPETNVLWK